MIKLWWFVTLIMPFNMFIFIVFYWRVFEKPQDAILQSTCYNPNSNILRWKDEYMAKNVIKATVLWCLIVFNGNQLHNFIIHTNINTSVLKLITFILDALSYSEKNHNYLRESWKNHRPRCHLDEGRFFFGSPSAICWNLNECFQTYDVDYD